MASENSLKLILFVRMFFSQTNKKKLQCHPNPEHRNDYMERFNSMLLNLKNSWLNVTIKMIFCFALKGDHLLYHSL